MLRYNPALPIGVHLRIEGSLGADRHPARSRLSGRPAHCSDGIRNKDETGVDCGGAHCGPYSPSRGEEITGTVPYRCTDPFGCGTEWRWDWNCPDAIPDFYRRQPMCDDWHLIQITDYGLMGVVNQPVDCGWHVVSDETYYGSNYDYGRRRVCRIESVTLHARTATVDPYVINAMLAPGGNFYCVQGEPFDYRSVGCIVGETCPVGWTLRHKSDGTNECFRPVCPPPSVPSQGQCLCP